MSRPNMIRENLRLVCVGALTLVALGLAISGPVAADEPSGLQVAAALENALVNAIAQSEKSVVAIARVKRGDADFGASIERSDPFGLRTTAPPRPTDADLIPNEYATGVVVDAAGLILTAHHVLREGSDYWVTTASRKTYKAPVKAADPRSDLAVLSIDAHHLQPIQLRDGSKVKNGPIFIAVGQPYA